MGFGVWGLGFDLWKEMYSGGAPRMHKIRKELRTRGSARGHVTRAEIVQYLQAGVHDAPIGVGQTLRQGAAAGDEGDIK